MVKSSGAWRGATRPGEVSRACAAALENENRGSGRQTFENARGAEGGAAAGS